MTSPRARPARVDRAGRTWNLWVPHSCPNLFDGTPRAGQDSAYPGWVFDRGRLGIRCGCCPVTPPATRLARVTVVTSFAGGHHGAGEDRLRERPGHDRRAARPT